MKFRKKQKHEFNDGNIMVYIKYMCEFVHVWVCELSEWRTKRMKKKPNK